MSFWDGPLDSAVPVHSHDVSTRGTSTPTFRGAGDGGERCVCGTGWYTFSTDKELVRTGPGPETITIREMNPLDLSRFSGL